MCVAYGIYKFIETLRTTVSLFHAVCVAYGIAYGYGYVVLMSNEMEKLSGLFHLHLKIATVNFQVGCRRSKSNA